MRLVRAVPITVALAGLLACSNLTSPPSPEPIASDTPVTAAASANPRPVMSAAHMVPRERPAQPQEQGQQADQGGELKIEDTVVGKGPAVKPGDIVVVHYTGKLLDGTKFDSSHDHPAMNGKPAGAPFETQIPGRLIQGWNKGIPGMRVGGKRRLTVPPSLGYGAMPRPGIPANSTLVFDIELLEIKSNPHPQPIPRGP